MFMATMRQQRQQNIDNAFNYGKNVNNAYDVVWVLQFLII